MPRFGLEPQIDLLELEQLQLLEQQLDLLELEQLQLLEQLDVLELEQFQFLELQLIERWNDHDHGGEWLPAQLLCVGFLRHERCGHLGPR
ncbi:MAG TPA: hypothetical protein VMD03_11005 [Steroidobacteraceae bacterium]|nr:hypothetical protein [Steroidobacteraceae bacterium]